MWNHTFTYLLAALAGCCVLRGGHSQTVADCIETRDVTATAPIFVFVQPGIVCFRCFPDGVQVTEGVTYRIENSNIPEGTFAVEDGVLVIYDTVDTFDPSNARTLRCDYPSSSRQAEVLVTVYRPPIITGETTVTEGVTLTLECNTQNSFGQPAAQWFNEAGQQVSPTSTLKVENISRTEDGTYTCRTSTLDPLNSRNSSAVVVVQLQAVSVDASFNDPRCETDERVCPNDPLLFTCTVTESIIGDARVTLPSGQTVDINSDNTISVIGGSLPGGVMVQSHDASVDGGVANYTVILAIERASILTDRSVICDSRTLAQLTDSASCPLSTDPPGSPLNLHQISSANTESSVVVQWESPLETGASGVYISEYTVTVDGNSIESVTDDGRDVFTHTISGLEYNTSYDVEVTAINSCDIQSQPATTTVFIYARIPPQPRLLPPVLSCGVPLRNGIPLAISWMYGEREEGVVYPGEEKVVMLELSPGGAICPDQSVSDTSCTTVITSDWNNYSISLTLSDDVGTSPPVSADFDPRPLKVEEREGPAVVVTLNPLCGGSVPYTVELSFGVREEDSGEECLPQQNISATILPGASRVLPVNTASLPLAQGHQYCYIAPTLNIEGSLPTSSTSSDSSESEGESTEVVAYLTLTLTLLVSLPVGVAIGMWCIVRRRGGGGGEEGGVEKREMGAIYEEPTQPLESVISLSDNQAYGQVLTRN